jgi:hypothetical protein
MRSQELLPIDDATSNKRKSEEEIMRREEIKIVSGMLRYKKLDSGMEKNEIIEKEGIL